MTEPHPHLKNEHYTDTELVEVHLALAGLNGDDVCKSALQYISIHTWIQYIESIKVCMRMIDFFVLIIKKEKHFQLNHKILYFYLSSHFKFLTCIMMCDMNESVYQLMMPLVILMVEVWLDDKDSLSQNKKKVKLLLPLEKGVL